jgi:hypothetical protein
MASYWIVVPRGNAELFDLLSMAFRGRSGFHVIVNRRATDAPTDGSDRRTRSADPGPDEIIVAECADRSAVGEDDGRTRPMRRLPVRRERTRAAGGPHPVRRGAAHRLLTL